MMHNVCDGDDGEMLEDIGDAAAATELTDCKVLIRV